jgi:hypothetical protein
MTRVVNHVFWRRPRYRRRYVLLNMSRAMKINARLLSPWLVCSFALAMPLTVLAQGVHLDTKVGFVHTSYETAIIDAEENYSGFLLTYFFYGSQSGHHIFRSVAFDNDSLAVYINTNYGRIAIDAESPEGSAMLTEMYERLGYDEWAESDFVWLLRTDVAEPHGRIIYGWADLNSLEDLASAINQLKSFKENRASFDPTTDVNR